MHVVFCCSEVPGKAGAISGMNNHFEWQNCCNGMEGTNKLDARQRTNTLVKCDSKDDHPIWIASTRESAPGYHVRSDLTQSALGFRGTTADTGAGFPHSRVPCGAHTSPS